MADAAQPVELRPETLAHFSTYVKEAEASMNGVLQGSAPFLWCEAIPDIFRRVRDREVVARLWSGTGPIKVPKGLIHDWVGSALIPGSSIAELLALIQDYDNHKNIYRPEVIDSKLLSRRGDDFRIYLRLLKKKVITVVLDTDHEVQYRSVERTRWICQSYTTRIAEVQNAGSPKENILVPDTGNGFLWRLYSYWRFEERQEGAYVECRAVSLTRDVPFGMGWIIEPIIQKLPKESLMHTLEATRRALRAAAQ